MEDLYMNTDKTVSNEMYVMQFGKSVPVKVFWGIYVLNYLISIITSVYMMVTLESSNPANFMVKVVLIASLIITLVVQIGIGLFVIGSRNNNSVMTYHGLNILNRFYMIVYIVGILVLVWVIIRTLYFTLSGFLPFFISASLGGVIYFILWYYFRLSKFFEDLKFAVKGSRKSVGSITFILVFSSVYAMLMILLIVAFANSNLEHLNALYSTLLDPFDVLNSIRLGSAVIMQYMLFFALFYFHKQYGPVLYPRESEIHRLPQKITE